MNDIYSQKMALQSNAANSLLGALAQALEKKRQAEEQAQLEQKVNSALYDTTQTRSPQVNPSISPNMQQRGNQINDIAGFNAISNAPTFQTKQTFNPTMEKLLPLLANMKTAPMVNNVLTGVKAMRPETVQRSPYEDTYKKDAFTGEETLSKGAIPKPTTTASVDNKLPDGFTSIKDSGTKAKIWNQTYGTNLSKDAFEEDPYYQPVIKSEPDEAGKMKDFVFWFNKKNKSWVKEEIGASALTADQRNRSTALGKVDPVLSSISELSEKINTMNGVVAKLSGGIEKTKAMANLNDDVSEYNSLISGFTPLVARAVGHSGVLTEQDVQSVKELFPKVGDSKSLRDRKIKRVKFILSGGKDTGSEAEPTNVKFDVGGTIYTVPSNESQEFLKDFPNAKRK